MKPVESFRDCMREVSIIYGDLEDAVHMIERHQGYDINKALKDLANAAGELPSIVS